DFSNLEWIGASFHQVTFQQCKLTGTNFAEGYLRDCSFNECLASMASFSNTNLKTVRFSDCQLEDTDF
ncbi:pentapeptide repeat-containing protein, partial [Vibrio parahaemolyticus]|nr:pentapeptide repeat-containing protein [Vibrio parahaemolyticus]